MLRVINSTVQAVAIDPDQEEAFEEAVHAGEQLRETYNTDEIGQKHAHYQLIAYTDPNGQHRFAVTADEPSESDWQDTDSFDEALALYEETVQSTAAGIGDEYEEVEDEATGEWIVGDRKAPFKFTDVPGVYGYEEGAEGFGNAQGRMLEAEWATEEAEDAQLLAEKKTQARQIAYARAVDEFGRGGNAALARRVKLSEPTVKILADKGRALLAEQFIQNFSVDAYEDNAGQIYLQLVGNTTLWFHGPVTADMHGKFIEDAQAWRDGDWDGPNENDGQAPVHGQTVDDLTHIATWSTAKGLEVHRDGNGHIAAGGGGCLYLGVQEDD